MWYRQSNDFMKGIIPNKGAEKAPLFNNEPAKDPFEGMTIEGALENARKPFDDTETIFDSDTPQVFYGNISAIKSKSYELGPGRIPSNKPATLYSV